MHARHAVARLRRADGPGCSAASRDADVLCNSRPATKVQDALLKLTGARAVPRVFVDGKFIGGGDDTAAMARDGRLKTMLAAVGVL